MAEAKSFNEIDYFEIAMNEKDFSQLPNYLQQIYTDFEQRNHNQCLELINKRITKPISFIEKTYLLHLKNLIFDREIDIKNYDSCLEEWQLLLCHTNDPLAADFYKLHLAILAYFESRYKEAIVLFKELANTKASTPNRIKALALFHLGLILRNQGNTNEAEKFFMECLQLSAICKNARLIERVKEQLEKISKEQLFCLNIELQNLIINKSTSESRQKYLALRRQSLRNGLSRWRCSLHALLPAIYFKEGRIAKAVQLLKFIEDPGTKVDVIKLFKKIDPTFDKLDLLLKTLESKTLFNTEDLVTKESTDSNWKLIQNKFKSIPNDDLHHLAIALKNHDRPVDKAYICKMVWNIDFDPQIHEYKVYKLIHKFRKYFGEKDVILNRYGKYQLNPKLYSAIN